MDYREAIRISMEYIESHLTENLTAEQIARISGYSMYHFCRIFAAVKGISLGDYIRRRRLSLSHTLLLEGKKIIDIALELGFETASGFSKAFRKEFGYCPTGYLARMGGRSGKKLTNEIGELFMLMQPVFKKLSSFKVAGYGIQTNVTDGFMKDIAAYWENYSGANLESKMYRLLAPPKHGEVGLCIPSSVNGGITYLFGVIVDDFSKVTTDMITAEVPCAEYAVFTTPPVDLSAAPAEGEEDPLAQKVKSTWRYIFEEWLPDSGYEYDENKLDFEFYDERCHNCPSSVMEIYIPIRPKKE